MTGSKVSRLGTAPEEGTKAPVIVSTTGPIDHIGEQLINGVNVVAGDRVLDKDNPDLTLNGIWVCSVGAWERATDFNDAQDIIAGQLVPDNAGGVFANSSIYMVHIDGDFSEGVSEITFTEAISRSGYGDSDVTALNLLNGVRNSVGYATAGEIRALPSPTLGNNKVELYGSQGGVFVADLNDTTTPEDGVNGSAGTVIVSAAGVRYKRLNVSTINVAWYGPTGDGVNNDTAPLQAAIDAAGPQGSIHFVKPAVTYLVSGLQTHDGQTWTGEGRDFHTLTGDGTAVLIQTNIYPSGNYPIRKLKFSDLGAINYKYNVLNLHVAPDSRIDNCEFVAIGATALSQILSVRCNVGGNRFLSGGSTALGLSGDNIAVEFANNCNGTDASHMVVSGGSGGSAVSVNRTQSLDLSGLVSEVNGDVGVTISSMRGYGGGFTQGETVTLTSVSGAGAGATGTAVVSRGMLVGITIVSGGANYVAGEVVEVVGATSSWGAATIVGTGAVTGVSDPTGGACSGIKLDTSYFEQTRRVMEIGLVYAALGVSWTGSIFGNSGTSSVAARDSAIHVGRAANLVADGFWPAGTGIEALIEVYDVTSGAGPYAYMDKSRITTSNITGYANTLIKNAGFTVAREYLIYGRNQLQLDSEISTGQHYEWISPVISANGTTGILNAIEPTAGGAVIDAIDIIDKEGDCSCTVNLGYRLSLVDTATFDPETLIYDRGYSRFANENGGERVRPGEGLIYRVVAGAGTGTFRIRLRYRY